MANVNSENWPAYNAHSIINFDNVRDEYFVMLQANWPVILCNGKVSSTFCSLGHHGMVNVCILAATNFTTKKKHYTIFHTLKKPI
jgi:predicted small integral membrane protein